MDRKIRISMLLFIFALVAQSCVGVNVAKERLHDAAVLVDDDPTSALEILDSVNASGLSTRRLKARYALLYSMALDKNYIDNSNDSLPRLAVEYYRNKRDCRDKGRAYYYLAISHYYAGMLEDALLEMMEVTRISTVAKDSVYVGLSLLGIADIFGLRYDILSEKEFIEKALSFYAEADMTHYYIIAQYKLGNVYRSLEEYDKAIDVYKKVLAYEDLNETTKRFICADYAHALVLAGSEECELVDSLYTVVADIYPYLMTTQKYGTWAYAKEMIGEHEMAMNILHSIEEQDSVGVVDYWKYAISKHRGDYHNALISLNQSNLRSNREIQRALSQSLYQVTSEYYKFKFESADKNKRQTIIITVISSLLLLVSCLAVVMALLRKISADRSLAEVRQEALRKLYFTTLHDEQSSMRSKYIALFHSKFKAFSQLWEEYYRYKDYTDKEVRLYKKISTILEEIRSDSTGQNEFEGILNKDMGNIMVHLRSEMPKMKEKDYKLISLVFAGFDSLTIAQMLDTEPKYIYERKYRIKSSIICKNPPHKEQFIDLL